MSQLNQTIQPQSQASHSGNSDSEVYKTEHPYRASFECWYNEEYAFFLRRKRQHYDLVIMEDGEYKWDTPKNAYRIWVSAMKFKGNVK